jgi:hypothetical protein
MTLAQACRLWAAFVCGSMCAGAAGTGLSTTLPSGQSLKVIEASTSERSGFSFEKRYPDGTRDRQFGPGGRVALDMGIAGATPLTVQSDLSGHLLITGDAPLANGSRGAVVVRFLSSGQLDSRWGDGGRALMPLDGGDSRATDVLPMPDGTLWVVGSAQGQGLQQASIWRVAASGHADERFGQHGAMLATALPLSEVVSVQRAPDGALMLAIQSTQGGKSWIEAHWWGRGDALPSRVARQELPSQWVGPAALVHRNGRWAWLDAAQPEQSVDATMLAPPDSPWARPEPPPTATPAPAAWVGQAALSPYAGPAPGQRPEPSPPPYDTASVLEIAALAVLLGLAGAAIWRYFRS